MINAQNRPKVTWHKLTLLGEIRVAKSYNYQVKYGGGYKDNVELSLEPGNGNLFFTGIRSNDFGDYKCTVRIGDDVDRSMSVFKKLLNHFHPPLTGPVVTNKKVLVFPTLFTTTPKLKFLNRVLSMIQIVTPCQVHVLKASSSTTVIASK